MTVQELLEKLEEIPADMRSLTHVKLKIDVEIMDYASGSVVDIAAVGSLFDIKKPENAGAPIYLTS